MSNFTATADFDDVPLFPATGANSRLLGGNAAAPMNLQAQALANRDAWLAAEIVSLTNQVEAASDTQGLLAFGTFTPDDVGAAANNKATLQAAMDAAYAAGYGTIVIPPGVYFTNEVKIKPGVTVTGYGATLKLPANSSEFVRIFDTEDDGSTWSGAKDSPAFTVKGLTFDGNQLNQTQVYGDADHQAGMLLQADPAYAGKLVVVVEDCLFTTWAGDGINTIENVDLTILNCRFWNCRRTGYAASGGWLSLKIVNWHSGGDLYPSGFQTEILDGYPGYVGDPSKEQSNITINGMILEEGNFDVASGASGFLSVTGLISKGGSFAYSGQGAGVGRFVNCRFSQTGGLSTRRLIRPGDVEFVNCLFLTDTSVDPSLVFACMSLYMNSSTSYTNQRIKFMGCRFVHNTAITGTSYGIHLEADDPTNENHLVLSDNEFIGAFTTAVYLERGSNLYSHNDMIDGALIGFVFRGTTPNWYRATISAPKFRNIVTSTIKLSHSNASNNLYFRNVDLEEANAVMDLSAGVSDIVHGNRIVRCAADPTLSSTPGCRGDIRQLSAVPSSGAWKWVCTVSHNTAATWVPHEYVTANPQPITTAGPTTLTQVRGTVYVNKTDPAGPVAVTLPLPNKYMELEFICTKGDESTNAVTLTAAGGGQINGAATFVLNADRMAIKVRSDGTNYFVTG
jgi:hypothetical protein